jgi:hypothetical protein
VLVVLSPAGASTSPQDTQPFPVAGSNILLTQDFVAAARGLSEALAALLPSAAALADADPGQGAAAAAAATEAVQGLKSLQGQMASAKAAAGRRSSEAGAGAAGAAAGSVSIQKSVEEGTASGGGLMGPPAPVHPSAAAAASESVFAQQQDSAFSPHATDAPIRTAALPVPILGPRRSHDGTSDIWRGAMSWTSRPRAVSASGGGDAMMGAASFDSINMSLPRRSFDGAAGRDGMLTALQQSPQDQQIMQRPGGLAAGAGAAAASREGNGVGAQPAACAGGLWDAEPMIVRQPSRRRSVDGSRPSLDERRQ